VHVNESTSCVSFGRVLQSTDYIDCDGQALSTICVRLCKYAWQVIDSTVTIAHVVLDLTYGIHELNSFLMFVFLYA